MIQLIGLIVGVYVIARSIAEAFSKRDGSTSLVGRIAYFACLVISVFLVSMIVTTRSTP